jgi:signal transduction histidine kinase
MKLVAAELPDGVEVGLDLTPALPRASCDAEQLRQVFLNLALNALEAMPRGGRLEISTRLFRDELALWRDAPRRADVVEIRFRDTGPGVPEEAREHVFVPFYTTKEKGTGLGLAICHRIVKSHGGTIGVRGAAGGGAEFVITLPAIAEERAEPAPAPERTSEGAAGALGASETTRAERRRRRLQTRGRGAK